MDVFRWRDEIVDIYKSYVQSFLRVADPRLQEFITQRLDDFFPPPLVQLNPAYEYGPTLGELARSKRLHLDCVAFFGDLRLYRHQWEVIERVLRGKHVVISSGTGSGKTLTYLVPIAHAILQQADLSHDVMAVVIYPLNALVNSQWEALQAYARQYEQAVGRPCPIRFGRFTGQEGTEDRDQLRRNPPHILLTNFMMLELMLVRPEDRPLIDRTRLRFLVLDELHSYRGRQGADVALLLRRLREWCGSAETVCIGTSATLATGQDRAERARWIADVATRLFGVPVEEVVEEFIRRVIPYPRPVERGTLRRAVMDDTIPEDWPAIADHPLAAWVEDALGVEEEPDGSLRRRQPMTLQDAAKKLSEESAVDYERCLKRLREILASGSRIPLPDEGDLPVFGIRLHQFLSQGAPLAATLEPRDRRVFNLEGQNFAKDGAPLFPVVFCRECGQDYYLVTYDENGRRLQPRPFSVLDVEVPGPVGYLMLDEEGRWQCDAEHLPDDWVNEQGRVRSRYRQKVPIRLWVQADASVTTGPDEGGIQAWFIRRPLPFCLNCGEVYQPREGEFRKLTSLSAGGRSMATTLTVLMTLDRLRSDPSLEPAAQKILGFTDNRQDAALQAGHFNDFVQTIALRSALVRALRRHKALTHDRIAQAVEEGLGLSIGDFARHTDLTPSSPEGQRTAETFRELLNYRLYEDLRRGWRVTLPNLEQVGLLRIEYSGLRELCEDDARWQDVPLLAGLSSDERHGLLRDFLDRMRQALAIEGHFLESRWWHAFRQRALERLSDRWFDENEKFREPTRYVLPGIPTREGTRSLGYTSRIGQDFRRFARRRNVPLDDRDRYGQMIHGIIQCLSEYGIVCLDQETVQIRWAALLWTLGDGNPLPRVLEEPRRVTTLRATLERKVNEFFRGLYADHPTTSIARLWSQEHTAQVSYERRRDREEAFRQGKLPCLFCSPTMELGIDIRDLHVVYLRNVPPTPTNYAQRSGRAGRAGRPALILTFAGFGNAHDQYFFRRREAMVAGRVRPPRLDLTNGELLKTHVYAAWLAETGISLKSSMEDILDLQVEDLPLREEVKNAIELSDGRLQALRRRVERVLGDLLPDLRQTDWFTNDWLEQILREAAGTFDRSLDRWRELWRSVQREIVEAGRLLQQAYTNQDERRAAERRQREALRQRDLLLRVGTQPEESDFYPYRYLAGEGFLPGYNFPRLPLRAFVPLGEGEFIARPRFLAITEFGPRNILYHEGAKYRVVRSLLPPGGLESRMVRAKWCEVCGYFHEGSTASVDLCEHCSTPLDGSNSHLTERLFEMTNVAAWRVERIFCDEEERLRQGYEVTTHFRFAPTRDGSRQAVATVFAEDGAPLARLTYGPAATLIRINHRWRTARSPGYALDTATGFWTRPDLPEDLREEWEEGPPQTPALMTGIRLMVRDTHDLLLFRLPENERRDDISWTSLQYALQRGMQLVFELEESELAAERIGQGPHRAILLWEAAEGSLGVFRQVLARPETLSDIARAAIEFCHWDASTGQDRRPECVRACYDCLLSYGNQLEHFRIDRHAIRDFLFRLARSITRTTQTPRDYDAQYAELRRKTHERSDLERRLLDYLYQTRRRLPDEAQYSIPTVPCEVDFFYRPNVCVFCDGAVHDRPDVRARDEEIRRTLKVQGYRVIVIRYDQDLEEAVRDYPDVFAG